MRIDDGYERVVRGPSPTAVRWWYFEVDLDLTFARGGRAPTCRAARRLIAAAREEAGRERAEATQARRPLFALLEDGSLAPLPALARRG